MLVLSRQKDESVILDFSHMTDEQLLALKDKSNTIEITITDIHYGKVRMGFTAPKEIKVLRKEIFLATQKEKKHKPFINKETIETIWNEELPKLVTIHIPKDSQEEVVVYEPPIVPHLTINGFNCELLYDCIENNIVDNKQENRKVINWTKVRKEYEKQLKLDNNPE